MIDNDLISIQESRILMENARDAHKLLANFPQEKLNRIVACMAESIDKHLQELAKMSCEETNSGKWEDKLLKNKFASVYLYNHIKDMNCVGIIREDCENNTMDIGVSMGVVVAILPATSPVSTAIYNALIAIKSGNAIVFAPHVKAQKSTTKAIEILVKAAESCGLPEGAMSYLKTVTVEGTKELIKHREASLILNTCVPEMLETAYISGKSVIYGGNGSGPVFVERTADLAKAAKNIITSKTFDNGMVSATEQAVVVDKAVAIDFKKHMQNYGAYFMTSEEADRLGDLLFLENGRMNSKVIGKTAIELADYVNINVPDSTLVLISEQKYVSEDNIYSREKLCPVLAYYIEDDWQNACEKCIELLLKEKNGHTLVVHSNDKSVINQFAIKKPVGRILINTPASFGSMGITTNLFPALSLGSGSVGKGISADNISPMNLIYIRKLGYGINTVEDMKHKILNMSINEEPEKDEAMLSDLVKNIMMHLEKK